MGQVINNVTNTNDAFRWTASFIKSGRLSSEGFLVLAFAADLSTNHNGSKVFLKSNNNLGYFLGFHSLAEKKVYLVKMYGWPAKSQMKSEYIYYL